MHIARVIYILQYSETLINIVSRHEYHDYIGEIYNRSENDIEVTRYLL